MENLVSAVISGVAVFIAGQALLKFVLEPIHRQRKIIGEVAFVSLMYANVQTHENLEFELVELTEPNEAAKELRRLAGELKSTLWTIPFYSFWSALKLTPERENIQKASSSLVGWSNSVHGGNPRPHKEKLQEALDLTG